MKGSKSKSLEIEMVQNRSGIVQKYDKKGVMSEGDRVGGGDRRPVK